MVANPKDSPPPTVVVVSGDAVQRHLLASLLVHHGIQVRLANSREEFISLIQKGCSVQAIVIERDSPCPSGQTFCEWLNYLSQVESQHIPILVLTSQGNTGVGQEPSQERVGHILTLPIDPLTFLARIDQMLDLVRTQNPSPRILLVSPNMDEIVSLGRGLQEMGWITHMTKSGKDTCLMLKELCPNLVLLGHPCLDGKALELVDNIKIHHPEIPIYFVSAECDSARLQEGLQHGVDEIIRLPTTSLFIQTLWEKRWERAGMDRRGSEKQANPPNREILDSQPIVRLAGEMAHDINNVLTAILGHATLLQQRVSDTHSVVKSAQVIQQAARRGKGLTTKLLGAMKPQEERRESVNLCEIVQEVLDLVQVGQQGRVHTERQFAAEDNWVKGDASQLHQIVLNLIVNAYDAMPEGGILSLKTQKKVRGAEPPYSRENLLPGTYLELIIKDTGSGIPEDVLPHIFEVFYTTKHHGSGIGLATVREMVQQNGGTVTVESQAGFGTTFHVLFPQVLGDRRDRTTRSSYGTKLHVLVVDDDKDVGLTTAELLKFLGYDVTVVDQGTSAIDLVRAQPGLLDLVVLDMEMASMDGPTCFRTLHGLHSGLPVILSSGHPPNNPILYELFNEGLAGFVQKPYDIQELKLVLDKVKRGDSPCVPKQIPIPASLAEDNV